MSFRSATDCQGGKGEYVAQARVKKLTPRRKCPWKYVWIYIKNNKKWFTWISGHCFPRSSWLWICAPKSPNLTMQSKKCFTNSWRTKKESLSMVIHKQCPMFQFWLFQFFCCCGCYSLINWATRTPGRNDCLTPSHQYWARSECHLYGYHSAKVLSHDSVILHILLITPLIT